MRVRSGKARYCFGVVRVCVHAITEQASHGLLGSAGLKMPIDTYCYRRIILTGEV